MTLTNRYTENQDRKNQDRKVWIVFTGKNSLWYLRFLKSNFRHCFILIEDKNHWITVDPLSSHTEIEIIAKTTTQSLTAFFEKSGFQVVQAKFYNHHSKSAPLAFVNCVEVAKRILGIHKIKIITPYQLYKFLNIRKDI